MIPTGVLPAIRNMKDFEKALQSNHDILLVLESRLSQLKSIVSYAKRENKDIYLHFDLIQGLKPDEFGMEFLIREVKPAGILSTRGNVIKLAKKNKLVAIQRMFLLDSIALEHNIKLIKRTEPDCVEVLPGLIPSMINKVHDETGLPVIAGGLVNAESEVDAAMEAGAVAVSTSNDELWDF
ncbi:glycerol-3-phosphate responsive antiterminator [Ornithinibacillus halophilus]|uniref:Glycerol uptake operon antiterminator regulatory protein n=1 Tax=Ornithinibacillus halophilus TaxID=930117 RepID=A0A1M5F0W9_9BACI|nr:glycerol-3-phosphate responsive antiterminator [Ornithinibacillus halophilus]SHF85175.1 glycerol uptake operon antiterminator [Ornithinibacillus halophilus]